MACGAWAALWGSVLLGPVRRTEACSARISGVGGMVVVGPDAVVLVDWSPGPVPELAGVVVVVVEEESGAVVGTSMLVGVVPFGSVVEVDVEEVVEDAEVVVVVLHTGPDRAATGTAGPLPMAQARRASSPATVSMRVGWMPLTP